MQFLAVSSIATLFGNHSQAAYVMANRYVEGLMQHRRAMSVLAGFGQLLLFLLPVSLSQRFQMSETCMLELEGATAMFRELSHRGLHGSFMNVGVISDVGFAAEQNLVREWQARGIKAVSSADVCLAMGQMLAWNLPSLGLSRKVDTMAYFQAISESFALSCLANRHLKTAKSDKSGAEPLAR